MYPNVDRIATFLGNLVGPFGIYLNGPGAFNTVFECPQTYDSDLPNIIESMTDTNINKLADLLKIPSYELFDIRNLETILRGAFPNYRNLK